ncbi:hypothetical protein Tco_0636134 [Tanacetum coccineum]
MLGVTNSMQRSQAMVNDILRNVPIQSQEPTERGCGHFMWIGALLVIRNGRVLKLYVLGREIKDNCKGTDKCTEKGASLDDGKGHPRKNHTLEADGNTYEISKGMRNRNMGVVFH